MYTWLNRYTLSELQGFQITASGAYQKLVMGNSVREVVDQNGERVVFTPASIKNLAGYLAAIDAAIAAKTAGSAVSLSPIRFVF